MTPEERLLRIENALAALSELAARAEERASKTDQNLEVLIERANKTDQHIDALIERANQTDQNFDRLSELAARAEERANRADRNLETLIQLAAKSDSRTSELERYFKMLTELAVRADERLDSHDAAIGSSNGRIDAIESNLHVMSQTMREFGVMVTRLAQVVERNISGA